MSISLLFDTRDVDHLLGQAWSLDLLECTWWSGKYGSLLGSSESWQYRFSLTLEEAYHLQSLKGSCQSLWIPTWCWILLCLSQCSDLRQIQSFLLSLSDAEDIFLIDMLHKFERKCSNQSYLSYSLQWGITTLDISY